LPEIYRVWAQVRLAQGRTDLARENAERSIALANELGLESEEGMSLRALGQALLAGQQHEAANTAFERSLSLLADRDPYEAARTKMQWGLAPLCGTRAERGRMLLQEAEANFERLGAWRDLPIIREALRSEKQ
jgi:tetratricopeptide (TPR) repeat protein